MSRYSSENPTVLAQQPHSTRPCFPTPLFSMRGSTKSPAIQKQPPFIRTPIEEEPPQPLPSVPVPMPHREVSTPTTVATTLSSPDAFPFALPPPALADELSPTRTERKEQRGSPSGWSDSSSSLSSVPSRASSIGPLAQQQPYKPSRLRQNDAEWTSSSQEDRPEEDGPVEKEEPEPAPEPKLAKVEPAPSQPLLPLPLLALVEIPQSFRQMLSQVCHVSIESLQKPEEFFKLKKKLLRKLWNFIAGARVGLPDSFRAINPSGLKRGQLEDGWVGRRGIFGIQAYICLTNINPQTPPAPLPNLHPTLSHKTRISTNPNNLHPFHLPRTKPRTLPRRRMGPNNPTTRRRRKIRQRRDRVGLVGRGLLASTNSDSEEKNPEARFRRWIVVV